MSEKKSKKKKQLVNKAKKIRSIVMMSLMCIMLLSAATYAWFSLSNSAKVGSLTMTVGSGTGLQVAEDNGNTPDEGAWKSSINAPTVKGKLLPATYDSTAKKFYEPVYNDYGEVTGVKDATEYLDKDNQNENKEGSYCTMTFYMRSQGTNADVCLVQGTNLSNADQRKGTYVVDDTTKQNSATQNAAASIRIAITANSQTVVYEPNSDLTIPADASVTKAVLNGHSAKVYSTIKQEKTGTFRIGGNTSDNSSTIFTLTKDQPTRVTIEIWIEGDDTECCNEIQLDQLIGQLQFKSTATS